MSSIRVRREMTPSLPKILDPITSMKLQTHQMLAPDLRLYHLTVETSEAISGERVNINQADLPHGWKMRVFNRAIKHSYIKIGSNIKTPGEEIGTQRELFEQITSRIGASDVHGKFRGIIYSIPDALRELVTILQDQENLYIRQDAIGNYMRRKREMLNAPWLADPKRIGARLLASSTPPVITSEKDPIMGKIRSTWKDKFYATERYGWEPLEPFLAETPYASFQGFIIQRNLLKWWQEIGLPRSVVIDSQIGQLLTLYRERRRTCF